MSKVLFTGLLAGALMAPQAGISAGGLSASANTLPWLTAAHPRRTRTSASYSRPSRTPRRSQFAAPVPNTPLNSTPLSYGTRFENEHCIHGEIMETVNGLEPG